MKKKILAILMSIGMVFGICSFTSACGVTDNLDMAIEVEELKETVATLEEENYKLKEELVSLKFELAFPKGLVNKSCILNNVKITRTDVNIEGNIYAVRTDGEGVEVTINGGYYDAGAGSASNIAIWAYNNSHVIINNGEFTTGNDVNGEANPVIYASGGSVIEINGGLFYSTGDPNWMVNCQNNSNSSIIITGGTFVNFNPTEAYTDDNGEGQSVSYVAEGYEVTSEEKEDGSIWYTVIKSIEEIEPEIPEVEEPEAPEEF